MGDPTQVVADTLPIDEFNHEADRIFWQYLPPRSGLSTTQSARSFTDVSNRIRSQFPDAVNLERSIKFIKRVFGIEMNEESKEIKLQQFVRMTKWFGSFRTSGSTCAFLEQINNLMSHTLNQGNQRVSPFAGMISQEEAEELLRPQNVPPESYLVRFSEGYADQGGFSLAVKADEVDIRHYNILGDPTRAVQSQRYNAHLRLIHRSYPELNAEEREHTDIVDFMNNRLMDYIEDHVVCTRICPDLPFNTLFGGYD